MSLPLVVIVNPVSGVGGRPGRAAALRLSVAAMLSARGVEPNIWLTEGPGHAHQIAGEAAVRGVRTVVAWGGDGTVNEVASALLHSETRLAIVPVGSGNGLARHLGISLDPNRAMDTALGTSVTLIDVGELDGRRFVNVAGIGLDAAIAHRFAADGLRQRGLRRYVALTLSEVRAYRGPALTVVANGETLRTEPLLLTLANGTQYGNGAIVSRNARADDGLLDMVIAERRSPLLAVLQAPMVFVGGVSSLPGVVTRQTSTVTITGTTPIRYHVDGEPGVGGLIVRASISPRALRVMVPIRA